MEEKHPNTPWEFAGMDLSAFKKLPLKKRIKIRNKFMGYPENAPLFYGCKGDDTENVPDDLKKHPLGSLIHAYNMEMGQRIILMGHKKAKESFEYR